MGQLLVTTVRVSAPDGGRRWGSGSQIIAGERLLLRPSVRS
jgi:hypothetical protein